VGKYAAVRQAIVSHLAAGITDAVVTDDYSKAANPLAKKVAILVQFWRFLHVEERSEPGAPTRDAEYLIGIRAKGLNETTQDHLLDDLIVKVEDLCNDPGHLFPIFGLTYVERCAAVEGIKEEGQTSGVYGLVTVRARILEG